MSISRHHAEWLSLLEVSGPFLSMPVLCDALPQGLDDIDTELVQTLRTAYEEWLDSQKGLRADPAMHRAWVSWVLHDLLDMDKALQDGSELPALAVTVAEQGETLRPDFAVVGRAWAAVLNEPAPRLLVSIYPAGQDLEKPASGKRWKASPATRMMTLLHGADVPLGLVTNGEQWMLVHAPKGQTTGFITWYADLWLEERLTLRAFRTLLCAHRFFGVSSDKTIERLLADSANDQSEVTEQLGYQVRHAVQVLVQAVDLADQDREGKLLKGISEERLYEAAVTVMMRLVFLLSAEERNLILSGDPVYAQHYAISTLRTQLREVADHSGEEFLDRRHDAWSRLLATFRAIYGGIHHDRMALPAYGGGLFDPDRYPFLEGRTAGTSWRKTPARPLPINNRTVLHLLDAVQMLQMRVPGGGPAEARRISFRALDIEQIGHVYENLLDHTAKRATEPILGLSGSVDARREVALAALEERAQKGQDALVEFVRESTGRTANAIRKALEAKPDMVRGQQLAVACGNTAELAQRAAPFIGLVRDDDNGHPLVILPGSIYVAAGQDRRSSGTHYTSRSLTEPIVEHTLEPLIYIGPREGKPRSEWNLRGAAEILKLLICDMAMGSGAFLVQTVRYLSERLLEAWERAERDLALTRGRTVFITAEGEPADDPNKAIPADPNERLALARRLLVDRCIYGVDKNPLAVEMAKLSLWLITMDKGRPFTFLDHALKCGDSLVGADEKQFLAWSQTLKGTVGPLYYEQNEQALVLARQKRRELQTFLVNDVRDVEEKTRLLAEAEAVVARVRQGCDLLVGVRLLGGLSAVERERLLAELLIEHTAKAEMTSAQAQKALAAARRERAFHWFVEFPEVFERGGFSAFIGNPPFLGGQRVRTALGAHYRTALDALYPASSGSADISALFFLRAFALLSFAGVLGLIATNTIAQGDTRASGLDLILESGGTIYRAMNNLPWPGEAAVAVNIIHIGKGRHSAPHILDSVEVRQISSMLDSEDMDATPCGLAAARGRSFIGSFLNGIGFVLAPSEANALIRASTRNREVVMPYLNAEDVNTNPDHSPSRWTINFSDWPLERAEEYPDVMAIVRARVYPQRMAQRDKLGQQFWWQFMRTRPEMRNAITGLDRVLVCPIVSKYVSFVFVPVGWVYAHRLVVFPLDRYGEFAVLQCSIHEAWARKYSSTLETRINYSPSDCFETFPFPRKLTENLESVGSRYYEQRERLAAYVHEGLTSIYNRVHEPLEKGKDVVAMRSLHEEMDGVVMAEYGWSDVALRHGFHQTTLGLRFTISDDARREVLARLLALNHQRYAEEVAAGLHDKHKTKKGKRSARADQLGLGLDESD